jgi:hypothetical protein
MRIDTLRYGSQRAAAPQRDSQIVDAIRGEIETRVLTLDDDLPHPVGQPQRVLFSFAFHQISGSANAGSFEFSDSSIEAPRYIFRIDPL